MGARQRQRHLGQNLQEAQTLTGGITTTNDARHITDHDRSDTRRAHVRTASIEAVKHQSEKDIMELLNALLDLMLHHPIRTLEWPMPTEYHTPTLNIPRYWGPNT